MCYDPNDYNSEECLREHIVVANVEDVGFNLHLTHQFGRARWGQGCSRIRPTQRGQILYLVVVVGREGVIAHDVTFGAYNTDKFLEFIRTEVIPSLDEQRFIFIDNIP